MSADQRPQPEKFDVVVIGAGPAGERGAAQAAYFGKKVALIERQSCPGGACANTGTLPSKTFRETALHLSGLASRGITGINISLNDAITAQALRNKAKLVIETEHERIFKNINKHGIVYVNGSAEFEDKNTVVVRDANGKYLRIIQFDHALIATGSSPHRPKEVPFDDVIVWDSDSVLTMKSLPHTMTVVGAGVIGAEYASIFSALGVKVNLLDSRDTFLPFLDREVAGVLTKEMERNHVKFYTNVKIKGYERHKDKVVTILEDGTTIEAETMLYAMGRNGNTSKLGLDKVGLEADKRGQLKVNANYQTDVPNIYAAGDVIGFPALASTSMDQGRLAMSHATGTSYRASMPEHLPIGIYTIPEVSGVGETQETAEQKGIEVVIGRAYFEENARAEIMGQTGGLLKLVVDARTRHVIGVHIVSERASEIIAPGLMACRLSVPIDFFIDTVFNYPTMSETYKYAAYDALSTLNDLVFQS